MVGARYKLHLPQRQEEARGLVVGALTQYSVEFANAVMHDFIVRLLRDVSLRRWKEVRRRRGRRSLRAVNV